MTLYIVSTPIGNLEDITFRAVRILKEVEFILAEDTRRTGKLLQHLDISNRLVSYHDRNKERKTPSILADLKEKDIALVSDAGTPGISDPGFYLVRAAREKNLSVVPIPGPNAAIAALAASGLPTDCFTFYGFPPKSSGKRKKMLGVIKERGETAILYVSPYRIAKVLKDISALMPTAQVVVARELTKKFEEFLSGSAQTVYSLSKEKKLKGEMTVIISPSQ